jgi:outer membrane protein OmpA-like peptidoglycan-associated protein
MAWPFAVWAQGSVQTDRKGCVESKIVSRMPGCVIMRCESKDYNVADMPRTKVEKGHQVEGEFENIVYRCPANKSPLELGRNTEAALKNAGFNILYTDIYGGGGRFYMTAQKGAQWVKLYVVSDGYDLTTVRQKAMDQMMTANADGWAAQINQSGRASIYGINFDTGKATIRPDSEAALAEIVKLLQANPTWAMAVAGHTDNVGARPMNLTLSRQRAQSVIVWLAAHGVDEVRLAPAGFGDTRPVADNTDEDGRQKNRRVDLVKLY